MKINCVLSKINISIFLDIPFIHIFTILNQTSCCLIVTRRVNIEGSLKWLWPKICVFKKTVIFHIVDELTVIIIYFICINTKTEQNNSERTVLPIKQYRRLLWLRACRFEEPKLTIQLTFSSIKLILLQLSFSQ